MKEKFRVNNFDLIRLIAALQVAIHHSFSFLELEKSSSIFFKISGLFPGVPIFFFVSGFLISKSFENNSNLIEYAQNRILRIFPALFICTFISILSVYLTGYLTNKNIDIIDILVWVGSQVSFVQFYNPDFMRGFGVGVLNGSLWTITVELQFYFLIPILYWLLSKGKASNRNRNIILTILIFMLFHMARYGMLREFQEDILYKLFGVSFLPWVYMFLVGVLFQKNFNIFYRFLAGKVVYILPAYMLFAYISVGYLGGRLGNAISPLLFISLAFAIFSAAYSFPNFSRKVLKGNDISYGVYIYHMPVVNVFIYYGLVATYENWLLVIFITIMLAILSWVFIEKSCIKLKRHPLNPLARYK